MTNAEIVDAATELISREWGADDQISLATGADVTQSLDGTRRVRWFNRRGNVATLHGVIVTDDAAVALDADAYFTTYPKT